MASKILPKQVYPSDLMIDTSSSTLNRCFSIVKGSSSPRCQSIGLSPKLEKEHQEKFMLRKVTRTLSDEVILTELAFDGKDIVIYEITSSVLVAEEELANPKANFKCFVDNASKEFFIEISTADSMKMFSRSALLSVLELAEEAGATMVYICMKKTIQNRNAYLKNFLFLGFQELNESEQVQISITKSHSILKYSIEDEGEL